MKIDKINLRGTFSLKEYEYIPTWRSSLIGSLIYYDNDLYLATDSQWKKISFSGFNPKYIVSNYQAESYDLIFADSENGVFDILLPSEPENGDMVKIIDPKSYFGTNSIIVKGNGNDIDNESDGFRLDVSDVSVTFIFSANTSNWVVSIKGNYVFRSEKDMLLDTPLELPIIS